MTLMQGHQMGSPVFQQYVIDALLNYHPLWLQLALNSISGDKLASTGDTRASKAELLIRPFQYGKLHECLCRNLQQAGSDRLHPIIAAPRAQERFFKIIEANDIAADKREFSTCLAKAILLRHMLCTWSDGAFAVSDTSLTADDKGSAAGQEDPSFDIAARPDSHEQGFAYPGSLALCAI